MVVNDHTRHPPTAQHYTPVTQTTSFCFFLLFRSLNIATAEDLRQLFTTERCTIKTQRQHGFPDALQMFSDWSNVRYKCMCFIPAEEEAEEDCNCLMEL